MKISGRSSSSTVGVVYVAASTLDARFARICIASVRRAYPQIPIRLLPGGPLQMGLVSELRRNWDVDCVRLPSQPHGWGFVKLEPLFDPRPHRFLMLDADTVMDGPILDHLQGIDSDFIVDSEPYDEAGVAAHFYDWGKLTALDRQAQPPRFVFNSGQWIGTSGKLDRRDFDNWIAWTYPRRLKHPHLFFPGEQGVLNYVLNRSAARGDITVESRPLMYWPGKAPSIPQPLSGPRIIHWAGIKCRDIVGMPGDDLLLALEREYYTRSRTPALARALNNGLNVAYHVRQGVDLRIRRFRLAGAQAPLLSHGGDAR